MKLYNLWIVLHFVKYYGFILSPMAKENVHGGEEERETERDREIKYHLLRKTNDLTKFFSQWTAVAIHPAAPWMNTWQNVHNTHTYRATEWCVNDKNQVKSVRHKLKHSDAKLFYDLSCSFLFRFESSWNAIVTTVTQTTTIVFWLLVLLSLWCARARVNRIQTLFIWFLWTIQQNDFFWIMDIFAVGFASEWTNSTEIQERTTLGKKMTDKKEWIENKKNFSAFSNCLLCWKMEVSFLFFVLLKKKEVLSNVLHYAASAESMVVAAVATTAAFWCLTLY